jgi:hypothetical protein
MKECDKRNNSNSSKIRIIYIYVLVMVDTLLPRTSFHFTTLQPTTFHSTSVLHYIGCKNTHGVTIKKYLIFHYIFVPVITEEQHGPRISSLCISPVVYVLPLMWEKKFCVSLLSLCSAVKWTAKKTTGNFCAALWIVSYRIVSYPVFLLLMFKLLKPTVCCTYSQF